MNFRPTRGNVFIRPVDNHPRSSIILTPDIAKGREMPQEGVVVAIGGKRITKKGVVVENEFKAGDRVWFPKHKGLWQTVGGEQLIQLKIHDVGAVLEEV